MSATKTVILIVTAVAVSVVLCSADLLNPTNVKDPRCHNPIMLRRCNTSGYLFRPNWTISGWFYHSTFKSCRPSYSPDGLTDCVENQDLPKTREECENLCADSCTMSNGGVGVCMFDF